MDFSHNRQNGDLVDRKKVKKGKKAKKVKEAPERLFEEPLGVRSL
jgi:hypothetical protein